MITVPLVFLLAVVAALAAVDLLLYLGVLPGGTFTRGIAALAREHPVLLRVGYLAVGVLGYWHFFG